MEQPAVAPVKPRRRDTANAVKAAMVDVNQRLTERQLIFVKHWAAGETIVSAGVRAGYHDAGQYCYRMTHMPNIQARYQLEKRKYEAASDMSRKKVMEGLQDGIALATLLGEPASVIAGWREIGRMCGYYEAVTVKHQVSVEGTVMVERMNSMTDDELFALIQKSSEQIGEAAPVPLLECVDDESTGGVASADVQADAG